MRELQALPTAIRSSFKRELSIGDTFTSKASGRVWEVKQIHRKDDTVELRGPGVEKVMQVTMYDLQHKWIKNG